MLAGAQGVAHLAQLAAAVVIHGDVQLALAEAAEGHVNLLHRHHNALDDDQGHPQHHNGGDHQRGHNHADGDVGGQGLLVNDLVLLILELLGQGVALGGRILKPGGAVAGDEGGSLSAALLSIAPGHIDDLLGLDLPRLHRIHKGVQLGPILQRVFALQRGQILLQLVDLGKGVVQVGHIAAQHRVPQAASGDVVVDTALRHNIVRADIVVKDTGILALLNGHQDNRRDDNDDRDDNCDAVTQDQALSDLHVFNHGLFPPKFS